MGKSWIPAASIVADLKTNRGGWQMVANVWLGFFTSMNLRVRIIKNWMTAPIMTVFKWEWLCWEKLTHHFQNSWCVYQPQPYYWSPIKFTHSVETPLVFIVSRLVNMDSHLFMGPHPFGFHSKVFIMEATWKAPDRFSPPRKEQNRNVLSTPFLPKLCLFFSVRRITLCYSIVFLANKAN